MKTNRTNVQQDERDKDGDNDMLDMIEQERRRMERARIEIEKLETSSEESNRSERARLNREEHIFELKKQEFQRQRSDQEEDEKQQFEEEKREIRLRCEDEMRKNQTLLNQEKERTFSIFREKLKEQDDLMKKTMNECLRLASNVENTETRLREIYSSRETQALERMRREFEAEFKSATVPKPEENFAVVKKYLVDTERDLLFDEIDQMRDDLETATQERRDAERVAEIERKRGEQMELIYRKEVDVMKCRARRDGERLRVSYKQLLLTCERQEDVLCKIEQKLEDKNQDCAALKIQMKQMQEEHTSALRSRHDAEQKLQKENEELRKKIESFENRRRRLDSSVLMVADANEALRSEVSKRIQLEGELRYTRRLSDGYKASWIRHRRGFN